MCSPLCLSMVIYNSEQVIKHITIDAVCLKHAQNGRGQGPHHGHLGFQGRDRSDSSQLKIALCRALMSGAHSRQHVSSCRHLRSGSSTAQTPPKAMAVRREWCLWRWRRAVCCLSGEFSTLICCSIRHFSLVSPALPFWSEVAGFQPTASRT